MKRIQDKVAVVTGASRGIGAAVARQLVDGGAYVVLAARDQNRLDQLAASLGDRVLPLCVDVTQPDQVQAMVDSTMQRWGRVDILINNAGVGLSGVVADVDLEALKRIFDVNVFGAVSCIQACVPIMRAQGSGHIVNISSILGKRAVPQTAGYAATKFALQALSDGLRIEEAPHGITVTVVCPGSTDTEFRDNEISGGSVLVAERPRVNMVSADRVAKATIKAIQKRRREILITPFNRFLNTLERLSPKLVDMALRRTFHR